MQNATSMSYLITINQAKRQDFCINITNDKSDMQYAYYSTL